MSQKSLNNVSSSDETQKKACHHTDLIDFETLLKVSEDLVQSADSYNTITATENSRMTVRSTNLAS